MKIAIVGSRGYTPLSEVQNFVRALVDGTVVVTGDASGVDAVAEETARERGLSCEVVYARWGVLGKSAGVTRNTEIVRRADRVVAFWDGKSPGTRDTIRKAREADKPLLVYGAGQESL